MKTTLLVFMTFAAALAAEAQTSTLDSGSAISDPGVLRALEGRGMGVGNFLGQGKKVGEGALIGNDVLAQLPAFAPIKVSLDRELADYKATHQGVGVGTQFGQRLFDPDYLTSNLARFALVGVVSRLDRAYQDPESCGEVRLIYRLAYRVQSNGEDVFSRLPMTINLVLGARDAGKTLSCAQVAQRWLDLRLENLKKNRELTDALTSDHGPLAPFLRDSMQMKRLEINMQIVRWPAAVRPDFGGHAEYLLKVYEWDAKSKIFAESTLENQIDRDRLVKNPDLLRRLKAYLLDPKHLQQLDAGTIVIPQEFLAKRAFSVAPGGNSRSSNQPFYGLISESEMNSALSRMHDGELEIIRSAAGFRRRANDITCTGCHQTRAIGGFHFMGRDPALKYPGNSVFVPASAHFFGELPRRQEIARAMAEGRSSDYSRGFASRPQLRRSEILLGSGLLNGWGAHCSTSTDASFQSWTCAEGLKCAVLHAVKGEPPVGTCTSDSGLEIGEPLELGVVTTSGFGRDLYTRIKSLPLPAPADIHVGSQQSSNAAQKTGGFPGGMIRRKTCDNLPSEAVCGALPAAKAGFNDCVGAGRNFVQCIREFAVGVGLRGCDRTHPCRDDYICAESYESTRGACVPPYFLFQFRVDGHPIGKAH